MLKSTAAVFMMILVLTLAALPAGNASAQMSMPTLDLPPGIAAQAQPLIQSMMMRMQQNGMSPEQVQMMMADMQTMVDQLPPGIFLQILKLMSQLDMAEMMQVHMAMHQGDLLQQPPGQILIYVQALAQ